jgi:protein ImuB
MEPLERHLEQRDRGAAVLHLRLHLIKGAGDRGQGTESGEQEAESTSQVYERTLQLPTPIRDARTLRTLALLDLESHPPSAAIDRVVVAVDPTPGRIVQYSLLTRPLPSPEEISTLMARLNALMGEGRCGAPAVVDSWQPGAFAMQPFAPREATATYHDQPRRHGDTEVQRDELRASVSPWLTSRETPVIALRRFRLPIPARVQVERSRPLRVTTDRRGLSGGRVEQCAGPWRTSGAWWEESPSALAHRSLGGGGWDRDEWDVTLNDGATYRVFRERDSDQWFLEGIVD